MDKKKQRKLNALNRLQSQADSLRSERERLQVQSYKLISPSEDELRIAQEARFLTVTLGLVTGEKLSLMAGENPF